MRFSMLCGIATMWAFVSAEISYSQEVPNRNELYVQDMNYRGTGCPNQSVVHNLSDDGQALTILFDNFVIETRRGRVASKNCIIELDMHVPRGWTFAILDVGFRGYAALDAGVTVRHNTVYRFGDYMFWDAPDANLAGPYFDDYEHYVQVPLPGRSWSRCSAVDESKPMRIRTRMGLIKDREHRDAEGLVTVDSIDGAIAQQYRISWQRCRVEPDANLAPQATTCGANLTTRGQGVVASFPINASGPGLLAQKLVQSRLACMRQRTGSQRCEVVRTGC